MAICMKDDEQQTPLHMICRQVHHPSSAPIAKQIIELCPEVGTTHDKNGLTPLHIVCDLFKERASVVEMARMLTVVCPEAVLRRDQLGRTPLHIVCENANVEMLDDLMKFLITSCPLRALSIRDKKGNSPLHCLLRGETNHTISASETNLVIRTMIRAFSVCYGNGRAPSRDKSRRRMDTDGKPVVNEGIAESSKKFLMIQDNEGKIPVHVACENLHHHKSIKIIRLLINMCPESVTTPDSRGMMPLHIICNNDIQARSLKVMEMLIETNPKAILLQDSQGNTPLHIVCDHLHRKFSIDFVEKLVKANPSAISVQNLDGKTPLHLVSNQLNVNVSTKTLILFLRICPHAASLRDREGKTPLHVLNQSNQEPSYDVLSLMVKAYPEAVITLDERERSPLSLFCENNMDNMEQLTNATDFFQTDTLITEKMQEFLETLMLFIQHAYHAISNSSSQTKNESSWYMLHATILVLSGFFMKCHKPWRPKDMTLKHYIERLILGMMQLHSDQVNLKDCDGNLPLHIAAANPITHDNKNAHIRTVNKRKNIIDTLLDLYPDAAKVSNKEGKLPLTLAIKSGTSWNDGVKSILKAYPAAITCHDIDYYFFPSLLAFVGRDLDLDTMNRIIRAVPNLVKYD